METLTKIEITEEEGIFKKEEEKTNTKFKVKSNPKLRMSYIVPEEIYPENIDIN